MVEYTIDDIRGPTVAREMAQLKEFVLAQFNNAIADAEAAAAAAATAAANAVLANTVKKTGEASQSIAGDVAVTGALDAAGIGSGSTPIVCGDLTAFGNVSLDDTVLQGNLSAADASALINLAGVGSVLVPDSTLGNYISKNAVNAPRLKEELDNYAPMVRLTGAQTIPGPKTFTSYIYQGMKHSDFEISQQSNTTPWVKVFEIPTARRQVRGRFVATDALGFFLIDNLTNTSPNVKIGGWGLNDAQSIAVTYNDGASVIGVWFKTPAYASRKIFIDEIGNYSGTSDFSYLTKVTPLQYVSAPSGDHITYSSAWSPIA